MLDMTVQHVHLSLSSRTNLSPSHISSVWSMGVGFDGIFITFTLPTNGATSHEIASCAANFAPS
jgi:hypothetical protein